MRMRWNRRMLLMSAVALVMAAGIMLVVQLDSKYGVLSLVSQFQSFKVTVHNPSDFELTILETGVVTSAAASASTDKVAKILKSGKTVKIKPRLTISGEGGIYLKYSDPREPDVPATIGVCSYTETLSGYSKVVITNDKVSVKENCS
ncbi:hypothetical protein KDC22_26310 [Paenibacillus tritici]|uniref:hypothetical protein n=1 Tax=Paenibacillus tritici TaxID=1873425 RepID=UPI001BA43F00|nr:hypothetical protein [Paenibacillus tritici]QUL53828.1 hypothetical protein KDC22_26310 [Paenibacillus tritici]